MESGTINFLLAIFLMAAMLPGCSKKPGKNSEGENDTMPGKSIEAVLKEHTEAWMSIPGVVGTAQSLCDDDQPCIHVYVTALTAAIRQQVPDTVEGYPVEIIITGEFRKLPDP